LAKKPASSLFPAMSIGGVRMSNINLRPRPALRAWRKAGIAQCSIADGAATGGLPDPEQALGI
jgi:hypothetical protein